MVAFLSEYLLDTILSPRTTGRHPPTYGNLSVWGGGEGLSRKVSDLEVALWTGVWEKGFRSLGTG